jgi:hypothetical protein
MKDTEIFIKYFQGVEEILPEKDRLNAIIITEKGKPVLREVSLTKVRRINETSEIYLPAIYERAYEYIVDESSSTIKNPTIIKISGEESIHLKAGEKVYIKEIRARHVRYMVDLGEEVRKGEKIAQTVSRKRVLRNIESDVDGKVVYEGQMLENPSRHVMIIWRGVIDAA